MREYMILLKNMEDLKFQKLKVVVELQMKVLEIQLKQFG